MNWDAIFGWTLAAIGLVGVIAWLVSELRNAPTLDESTPLDELMGGTDAWAEPLVLAGAESLTQAGDCCVDCGKPATHYVPFAMSSVGTPIEQALCKEHADYALTDDAGSES